MLCFPVFGRGTQPRNARGTNDIYEPDFYQMRLTDRGVQGKKWPNASIGDLIEAVSNLICINFYYPAIKQEIYVQEIKTDKPAISMQNGCEIMRNVKFFT